MNLSNYKRKGTRQMKENSLVNSEMKNKKEKIKMKIVDFLKQPLIYILLISVFFQIKIYDNVPEYLMTSDSYSYTVNFDKNFLKGEVDSARTPVYPYFVKVIKKIGGEENLFRNIVLVQKILFIITVILFYYCIQLITDNKIIKSIFTLSFAICPCIILWNVTILTESIALFEIAFLAFLTLKYLKRPNAFLAVGMRNNIACDDYDKTCILIYASNIFVILDFKDFLR